MIKTKDGKLLNFRTMEEMLIYIEEHRHEFNEASDNYSEERIESVGNNGYKVPKDLVSNPEFNDGGGDIVYCASEDIARAYFDSIRRRDGSNGR